MADLVFPLIIADGLDVSMHGNLSSAEMSLEGLDVIDGQIKAFDAAGRALNLEPMGVTRGFFGGTPGTVRISLAETEPETGQGLREILTAYLRHRGEAVDDFTDIPWMIERCKQLLNYQDNAV